MENSHAQEVKNKIFDLLEKIPDDELEKLYDILTHMPFFNKATSGEELSEKEMQNVQEYFDKGADFR